MTTPLTEYAYDDADALAAAVAARLHGAIVEAITLRGSAVLSLAGGRTPFPAYRQLAESDDIDWSRVVLLPGDDRCAAWDHPASNLAGLRAAFADTHARIESLTTPDGDPGASLLHARGLLAPMHVIVFDAVVLGMGEDAHTASLFPGAAELLQAMDPDTCEDAFLLHPDPLPPEAPFPRITLGLARLRRARSLHLLVTGARKRDVLQQAMTMPDLRHPVAAVLHVHPDAHVHWSP